MRGKCYIVERTNRRKGSLELEEAPNGSITGKESHSGGSEHQKIQRIVVFDDKFILDGAAGV